MFRLVSRILDNKKNHPPLNLPRRMQKEISSVRPLQTPLHILKVYSTKVLKSTSDILLRGDLLCLFNRHLQAYLDCPTYVRSL